MLKRMAAAAVLTAALVSAGAFVYAETAAPAPKGDAAVSEDDEYYGCPGWRAARRGDTSWRCPGYYGNAR